MKKIAKFFAGLLAIAGAFFIIVVLLATVYPAKKAMYDNQGRRIISKNVKMLNAEENLDNQVLIVGNGFVCDYVDKGWIDYSTYSMTAICNNGRFTYKITADIKSGNLAVFLM